MLLFKYKIYTQIYIYIIYLILIVNLIIKCLNFKNDFIENAKICFKS